MMTTVTKRPIHKPVSRPLGFDPAADAALRREILAAFIGQPAHQIASATAFLMKDGRPRLPEGVPPDATFGLDERGYHYAWTHGAKGDQRLYTEEVTHHDDAKSAPAGKPGRRLRPARNRRP